MDKSERTKLVSCPCGKQMRVRDDLAGKKVKCPGCGSSVLVEACGEAPPELRSSSPPPGPTLPPAPADNPFYWVDPDTLGLNIFALSDEAIFSTNLDVKELARARRKLDEGEPVADVLAEARTIIPFDRIHKVESNVYHAFIDVIWQEKEGAEKTETNLLCPDQQARDEMMDALEERLGWKRRVVEVGRLRASLAPLVVVGLFGLLTFCFTMAALHPDSGDGSSRVVRTNWLGAIFVWALNLFGPVGAALLGVPFVLSGLVWLGMRMHHPPILLTLTRGVRGKKRRE